MADQEYQVVFRGEILPDMPMDTVKANLAKLFQADAARIEGLFGGRAVILKKGLGREEGERYRLVLEKAGILCQLVPSAAAPAPAPKVSPPEPDRDPRPGDQGRTSRPAQETAARAPGPGPAPVRETAKTLPDADLHQRLGAIRDKVREIDVAEAGKMASSWLTGITLAARSGLKREGIAGARRGKAVWALAAAACLVMVVMLMMSGASRPMPVESRVIDKFAKQYYREIRKTDLGSAATSTLIGRAREVVEDMGFDFDRTLILWLLHKDLVERQGALEVYRTMLVEPVAVAVAAGLSDIDAHIAPETRQIFESVAAVPPGVDLLSIRMVRACPSDGYRLKHADLLQVLEEHAMAGNAGSPDLAIADAFFGLERAGFIKIHRRWENDRQFSDIEILDLEGMRRVEAQIDYLAAMKVKFADK